MSWSEPDPPAQLRVAPDAVGRHAKLLTRRGYRFQLLVARVFIPYVVPLVGVGILTFGGYAGLPAGQAAMGYGQRGFFTAQVETCGRHGCTWSGPFRLLGGQVTMAGAIYADSNSAMHVGSVVPALDNGSPVGEVFAPHGSHAWIKYATGTLFGAGIMVGWARYMWRRRSGQMRAQRQTGLR